MCCCNVGVRLLSSERLAAAQREWASEGGADSLFANGNTTRWGLGYHLYPFSSDGSATPRQAESVANGDVAASGGDSDGAAAPVGPTEGADAEEKGNAGLPAGAFGHSGIGGSVALCDPQNGLAVAVTVNHLVSHRMVAKRVMGCITEVLGLHGKYDDFA